jgi:hypothetical protein
MVRSLVSASPDREERALLLTQFAETLGHAFSVDQLDGYLVALQDVPLAHLRLGLALGLRTLGKYGLPKPVEIRASVDAALAKVPAPAAEHDPRTLVHCPICADTGLAYVRHGQTLRHAEAQGAGLAMRPCGCRESNPVIRRRLEIRTRYAEENR